MASDIPILNPSLNGIILSVGFLFGQIGQVGQLWSPHVHILHTHSLVWRWCYHQVWILLDIKVHACQDHSSDEVHKDKIIVKLANKHTLNVKLFGHASIIKFNKDLDYMKLSLIILHKRFEAYLWNINIYCKTILDGETSKCLQAWIDKLMP